MTRWATRATSVLSRRQDRPARSPVIRRGGVLSREDSFCLARAVAWGSAQPE